VSARIPGWHRQARLAAGSCEGKQANGGKRPGGKVLAHIEKSGRHFGMKVEESLIER